jgi:hypothetical protein
MHSAKAVSGSIPESSSLVDGSQPAEHDITNAINVIVLPKKLRRVIQALLAKAVTLRSVECRLVDTVLDSGIPANESGP